MFSALFSHNLILYNSITISSLRGEKKGQMDADKGQFPKPIDIYIIKMMNRYSLYPVARSTTLGKQRVGLLPEQLLISKNRTHNLQKCDGNNNSTVDIITSDKQIS